MQVPNWEIELFCDMWLNEINSPYFMETWENVRLIAIPATIEEITALYEDLWMMEQF